MTTENTRRQRFREDADEGCVCEVPMGMSTPPVEASNVGRWTCMSCFTLNHAQWSDCAWCGRDKPLEAA